MDRGTAFDHVGLAGILAALCAGPALLGCADTDSADRQDRGWTYSDSGLDEPDSKDMALAQFMELASADLAKWEEEAPEDVKEEIRTLREGDHVSRAEAAIRLAKMGPRAQGAIAALIEILGDRILIRPGDFFRLFGAQDFCAGSKAEDCLVAIAEPAIPALICALSRGGQYERHSAANGLARITGQDLGQNCESWMRWSLSARNRAGCVELQ